MGSAAGSCDTLTTSPPPRPGTEGPGGTPGLPWQIALLRVSHFSTYLSKRLAALRISQGDWMDGTTDRCSIPPTCRQPGHRSSAVLYRVDMLFWLLGEGARLAHQTGPPLPERRGGAFEVCGSAGVLGQGLGRPHDLGDPRGGPEHRRPGCQRLAATRATPRHSKAGTGGLDRWHRNG